MSTVYAAVYIPAPILSLCCAAGSRNPDLSKEAWARNLAAELLRQLKGVSDSAIQIDWTKIDRHGVRKNEDTLQRLPRYMYDATRKYRPRDFNDPVNYVDEGMQEVADSWKTPDEDVIVGDEDVATGYNSYAQRKNIEAPSEIDLIYKNEKALENGIEEGEYDVGYENTKDYAPDPMMKVRDIRNDPKLFRRVEADVKDRIKSLTIKDLHNVIVGSPGTKYDGLILLEFMNYPYPKSVTNKPLDYFYIKVVADTSELDEASLESFYDDFKLYYNQWVGPTTGEYAGKKDPICSKAAMLNNRNQHRYWEVISFHDGRNSHDKNIRTKKSNDKPPTLHIEDWTYPKGRNK